MPCISRVALALLLVVPSAARAEEPPVRIVFQGRVDLALAALLTSELAANGRSAYVVLAPAPDEGARDEPVLEIYVDGTEAYAVARPSRGVSNTAPLPVGDPEAAALGAVSLILEPPSGLSVELAPTALGAQLARPSPAARVPHLLPELASPPPPHRGLILELDAAIGVIANGAGLAVGAFVERDWLLSLHGRGLYLWTTDRLIGAASVSFAYVGRSGNVDLEVGVEGGVLGVNLDANAVPGAMLGGFVGVAIEIDPAVAVLARLGGYAGYLERSWMPGLLLSIGARISP